MEYKIVMPVLSDTMDKGKLVKWHVKEGDFVKEGDVIAEVESDKAVMKIQTFKSGIVKKLLAKEGDEVPVKETIAIIETDVKEAQKPKSEIKTKTQIQKPQAEHEEEIPKKEIQKTEPKPQKTPEITMSELPEGSASPAAKKLAGLYNIDIQKLQKQNSLPTPAHEDDIKKFIIKKYFTPKAAKLVEEYNIDINEFKLDHKINSKEVEIYIKQKNIPKITSLTPNQKAVIKTVENSWSKPTYFIFEDTEISKIEGIKLTANIIKALALAMQDNPLTRSILNENKLLTYPSSNISVALSRNDGLYMVVIKNAEEKNLNEINEWLKEIKTKRLTINDLSGSTFGLSNLGMFNVKRFTALINNKDSGIMAVGSLTDGKIKISFTFDHRIINGADGAKFVNDFKNYLKEIK